MPDSFDFGYTATINENAEYSFVFGKTAVSFAPQSFAIGNEAVVGAVGTTGITGCIAIGNRAKVEASNALAIGNTSEASGVNSISVGANKIVGSNTFAFGINNNLNGTEALLMGSGNEAGNNAIAIGSSNKAGDKAIAIGRNLDAAGGETVDGEILGGDIIIGYEDDASSPSVVVGTEMPGSGPRIVLGTGMQHGTNDVMMLGRMLTVTEDADYSELVMLGNDVYSNWATSNDPDYGLRMDDAEDNYPVFLFGVHRALMGITSEGNAYFKGDVTANGWSSTSDFRLKDNIRPVSYPLTLTDSLQPVSYYLKSDKSKQQRLGFIAQEVQRYFPCLVREGSKGMLRLDYMGLIPVLWDFSKQLRQENMELKKEAAEQAARIDKLEAEIEAIKELLNQDK